MHFSNKFADIDVIDDGIMILFNVPQYENIPLGRVVIFPMTLTDTTPLKTKLSNTISEEKIVIWDNDLHLANASHPIDVTEEGIIICLSDEHLSHKNSGIFFIFDGNVISFNEVHPSNAFSWINSTYEGIFISINFEHS